MDPNRHVKLMSFLIVLVCLFFPTSAEDESYNYTVKPDGSILYDNGQIVYGIPTFTATDDEKYLTSDYPGTALIDQGLYWSTTHPSPLSGRFYADGRIYLGKDTGHYVAMKPVGIFYINYQNPTEREQLINLTSMSLSIDNNVATYSQGPVSIVFTNSFAQIKGDVIFPNAPPVPTVSNPALAVVWEVVGHAGISMEDGERDTWWFEAAKAAFPVGDIQNNGSADLKKKIFRQNGKIYLVEGVGYGWVSDINRTDPQFIIDPVLRYNGTDNWAGTSGTMIEHGDGNLRNEPNVTTGLVSMWSPGTDVGSGDTLTDIIGVNDGTIHGATWNMTSGMLEYNGTSDYVDCGNDPSLNINTSDYSISAWIYHPGIVSSSNSRIVTKYDVTSGVRGFSFVITPSKHLSAYIAYGGVVESVTGSTTDLTIGGQQHLVLTIDRDSVTGLKLYVGGGEETYALQNDPTPIDGEDITSTSNMRLGSGSSGYETNTFFNGSIGRTSIYNSAPTNTQINETNANYHTITSHIQTDTVTDYGSGQVLKHIHVTGTDPSANTTMAVYVNGRHDNITFNGWELVNGSCNVGDNVTVPVAYEYRYTQVRIVSNTSYQPETNVIESFVLTSDTPSVILPPQNLTNTTSQNEICFNWDDYVCADYWNISQRIPSIPYTDIIIVLDGIKDQEFIDRAHTWILDSPNPTGSNGDKESISWIRNSTTLSGYADGEDNDALNNDDSFKIMLDMTANNLTTDDRQFILSESGTVTAKRWGGSAWLPQSTNAEGVVIGAGIAGSIQYEMQIPISELTNFNNGSTIKLAMERKDTSQNPDVIKYYPLNLINDTDATIWTSINLTAESEYTFLGNTTLSNYTVTGLTPFTWYRHRFSTINGSTESSYVYSNDITEQSTQYIVSGYILTELGTPISDATVWSMCDCGCVCEVVNSNITGYYQGDCFYNGTYTIYASKTDYYTNSTTVVVNGLNKTNVNITLSLTPAPTPTDEPIGGGGGGYLGDIISIIDIVDAEGVVTGAGIRIGSPDAGFTIDLVSISNILTGKDKANTWTVIGLFSILLIIIGFYDGSKTARGELLISIGLAGLAMYALYRVDIFTFNFWHLLGLLSASAFIYGFFLDTNTTARREFLTVSGIVGIFIYAIYQSKIAVVIGLS